MQIKFGTDGWRAIIAKDFTIENLTRVTEATAKWLWNLNTNNPSVMVGYDCRFGGKLFAEVVANVLAHHQIKVFITPGFVSTPMVSLATVQRQCTAGIIITASHNPPEYSGFKIKASYGGPAIPSMIEAVENNIPEKASEYPHKLDTFIASKKIEYYDAEALYINTIKQSFQLDKIKKSGFKLGYDAMYGAGQNVIKKLFPDAVLLHCDYNPSFMGQAPEPIARNLVSFQELIREEKISIGLATDGDADRIGLFDENGNFVDSHHIILLLIHYLHQYKNQRGKIVCTFSCSSKISKLAQFYGLPIQITKIGFKYICEIMQQEVVMVGGEESGGISVMGHIPERDGIWMGLLIYEFMAITGKTITQLLQEIYQIVGPFAVDRYDLHLPEEQKNQIIQQCKDNSYKQFGGYTVQEIETIDGYKFHLGNDRWVMIRPSGTEPLLRVYAEAETLDEVYRILDATKETILK